MNLKLLTVTGRNSDGLEFGLVIVTDQLGYEHGRTAFENMARRVFRSRYPDFTDLRMVWTDYEDPEGDA